MITEKNKELKTLADKKAIKTFVSINENFIVYYEDDVKEHIDKVVNKIGERSFNNGYHFEMIKLDDIIEIFKEEFGSLVE